MKLRTYKLSSSWKPLFLLVMSSFDLRCNFLILHRFGAGPLLGCHEDNQGLPRRQPEAFGTTFNDPSQFMFYATPKQYNPIKPVDLYSLTTWETYFSSQRSSHFPVPDLGKSLKFSQLIGKSVLFEPRTYTFYSWLFWCAHIKQVASRFFYLGSPWRSYE